MNAELFHSITLLRDAVGLPRVEPDEDGVVPIPWEDGPVIFVRAQGEGAEVCLCAARLPESASVIPEEEREGFWPGQRGPYSVRVRFEPYTGDVLLHRRVPPDACDLQGLAAAIENTLRACEFWEWMFPATNLEN